MQPSFPVRSIEQTNEMAGRWLFTPRGCAVLHVPKRNQHLIRTTFPTSHGFKPLPGASSQIRNPLPPTTKSDFVNLFQFVATADNTPYYCVPAALNFRQNLCGGEEAIYNYIRDIAQRGADLLAMVLGTEVMDDLDLGQGLKTMGSYEAMRRDEGRVGWAGGLRDCAMANVLLPITIAGASARGSLSLGPGGAGSAGGLSPALRQTSYGFPSPGATMTAPPAPWTEPGRAASSPLHSPGGPIVVQVADVPHHIAWMEKTLVDEFHTFVAIYQYNGQIWTRISGQIYLELKDFEWLGGVLKGLCERLRTGESLKEDNVPVTAAEEVDLEAIGKSVSELSLNVPPSRAGTKRFDVTQGGWVEA